MVLHGIASDLARTSVVCDDSTKSYAMAGGDQSFQTRMKAIELMEATGTRIFLLMIDVQQKRAQEGGAG